jgi:hypothetical protein
MLSYGKTPAVKLGGRKVLRGEWGTLKTPRVEDAQG